jgi:hypothetical protein
LSHLYIKTNISPRQARGEHRENSKKSGVFLQELPIAEKVAKMIAGTPLEGVAWGNDEVRRLETPMSCFQLSLIFCQDMLGTNKR